MIYSLPSIPSKHNDVDIAVIRENTEGEFSGIEHEVVPGVVENLKIISSDACERIAQYAFEFASSNNRKSVCAAHKMGVQ